MDVSKTVQIVTSLTHLKNGVASKQHFPSSQNLSLVHKTRKKEQVSMLPPPPPPSSRCSNLNPEDKMPSVRRDGTSWHLLFVVFSFVFKFLMPVLMIISQM